MTPATPLPPKGRQPPPPRPRASRFGVILDVAVRERNVSFADETGLHFQAFTRDCCTETKIVSRLATFLRSDKPPQSGYEDLEPNHAQTSRYLHRYFIER
ncbi:hypothetical protein RB7684 [Rhodopirellula baltica SH 1]|uniref:Uncharacterized protein n=1 Tax=Rhodopirellula baltica (strain DSM 10527 / NCIMB 13988 / SH1) TaxID=243090 RepID=Q7UNB0_RHOBA|nr:hypothetical protein RB7684 [Rhodopirellula baltica SH 1]